MNTVLKTLKKPYKINLPIFEGPLDLLLYLIQKQELDIYDIPIAQITSQYLEYLEMMELLDLEIAGEFLVMTATLMEIKSKMLLPLEETQGDDQAIDPRTELVNRLLEYQRFKEAALQLEHLESLRRDFISRNPIQLETLEGDVSPEQEWWSLSLYDLMKAMKSVLDFSEMSKGAGEVKEIWEELVTVEGKIQWILELLAESSILYFSELLKNSRGRIEKITTLLASLELAKVSKVSLRQQQIFGEVEIVRVDGR